MKNEVHFDGAILFVVAHGEADRAEAQETVARSLALLSEAGLATAPLCVDVSDESVVTAEARKAYSEAVESGTYPRIAFVGATTFKRTAANLLMRASGRADQTRFFSDTAAALRWLTDEKEGSFDGSVRQSNA